MTTVKQMTKPSEFLAGLDSHGIYDDAAVRAEYEKETGRPAPWQGLSGPAMKRLIKNRGLGGFVRGGDPVIGGYQAAEAVAEEFCDAAALGVIRSFIGRGGRFQAAIAAIQKAGY